MNSPYWARVATAPLRQRYCACKASPSSGMDEFDRNALQMPLEAFQDAFAMDGAVHEIVVVGRRLADAPAIKAAMETALARMDSPAAA
jgi:ABC-type lipoprotein release transport system permease subunit